MPRGRPRKNPLPDEVKNPAPTTEEKTPTLSTPTAKSLPTCDRCHKESNSLSLINLTSLTMMASWHREVITDRPRLCRECCKKLNKIVDDFLIDKGNGVQTKYGGYTAS